jgi:RHS repeat-associated protein
VFDSRSNVTGLVNESGGIVAAYSYDAFGRTTNQQGSLADTNPMRFSTQYTDKETGLVCFGYRYYSPRLGRFLNRDPIGEAGGVNLYGFCGNDPVNSNDFLGLNDDRPKRHSPPPLGRGMRPPFSTPWTAMGPMRRGANDIGPAPVASTAPAVPAANSSDEIGRLEKRIGDIRILRADVRINRVGHGPDIDKKVEAFIEFADAMSKYGTMPITGPDELAVWLLQIVGFPTNTGNASDLLVKYLEITNSIPPLEAYVTFEYQIYLGERGWFLSLFLGDGIWTEPILIENELVVGAPLGFYGTASAAIEAAMKRLVELQKEAINNKYRGLRKYRDE